MTYKLLRSDKLHSDYKYTYTLYELGSGEEINETYIEIIRGCKNLLEADDIFFMKDRHAICSWDTERITNTKEQQIKNEIYELVLDELFDGEVARYEWVDTEDDYFEYTDELQGIEKIMIEHEAYNRYMNTRSK